MAKSTFSGPVVSNNGFMQLGANNVIDITADTTLTVDAHAGRIIEVNDADGVITLPTIKSSEIGAKYTFLIQTNMTGKIKTDGTDKYVGTIMVAVDDGAKKSFVPGATNDVFDMNNGTKGGKVGSYVEITALATAEYMVQGVLIGSGSVATPFADS